MGKTFKDLPYEISGKFSSTGINRRVKLEQKNKRKKLNKLDSAPPPGYIKKFLADRWNWD
jgi:hypothetical protein